MRPRFSKVKVVRGETRYLFCLERPDGTRKVWSAFSIHRRHAYPGQTFKSPRGFTIEVKVFE